MNRTLQSASGCLVAFAIGCTDTAKPEYEHCVSLEAQGNVLDANDACEASVTADPNSKSGQLAAKKLADMKPRVEQARAEKDKALAAARAAQAKADEEERLVTTKVKFAPATPQTVDDIEDFPTKCINLKKPRNYVMCVPTDTGDPHRSSIPMEEQQDHLCPKLAEMNSCKHAIDGAPRGSYYCCP